MIPSHQIVLFLIFITFFCFSSSLLYLNVKNETSLSTSSKSKYICHTAKTEETEKINNGRLWRVQNFGNESKSLEEFVRFKTIDTMKYSDYFESFKNPYVELWIQENQYDLDKHSLFSKVEKLVNTFEKCPNEPKFVYQTHLYCMVKKFLMDELKNHNKKNHFTELSRAITIFYLAQNFNFDVRLRLIVKKDTNDKFSRYSLSIVRTKRLKKYKIDNFLKQKNGKKTEKEKTMILQRKKQFSENFKVKNEIENFDVEKYRCDLFFFIQDNVGYLKGLKKLEDFNIEMENKNEALESEYVFLTMHMMQKDLKKFIDSKEEYNYFSKLTGSDIYESALKKKNDVSENRAFDIKSYIYAEKEFNVSNNDSQNFVVSGMFNSSSNKRNNFKKTNLKSSLGEDSKNMNKDTLKSSVQSNEMPMNETIVN